MRSLLGWICKGYRFAALSTKLLAKCIIVSTVAALHMCWYLIQAIWSLRFIATAGTVGMLLTLLCQ